MKKVQLLLAALVILAIGTVQAQLNVGVSAQPVSSAVLQATSTTKGFLPPVMTSAQMNAIVSPATGLMVYCSDCNPLSHWNYNGTSWVAIGSTNFSDAILASLSNSTSITNYNAASVNDYVQVTQVEYDNLTTKIAGITNYGMKLADRAVAAGTANYVNSMPTNSIPTTAIPFAFSTKMTTTGCVQLIKQTNTVGALGEVAWSSATGITLTTPASGTYYFVIKSPNIFMPANTNIAVHGFNNGWGGSNGGTGGDGITSSTVSGSGGASESNCTLVTNTISSLPTSGTWPATSLLNYDIKWTTTKQW